MLLIFLGGICFSGLGMDFGGGRLGFTLNAEIGYSSSGWGVVSWTRTWT